MGETRWQRSRLQKNGFQHAIHVATDFSIREAQYGEAFRFKRSVTLLIGCEIVRVAIHLDDQPDCWTEEVYYNVSDDGLTPELQPF